MKKKALVIVGSILIVLVVVFAIYLMVDTDSHTPKGESETNSWEMPSDLTPVLSFGNQQQKEISYCAFDGDDIYVGESGTFRRGLVKFQIETPTDVEKIYTKFHLFKYRQITQVALFDHWLYFVEMGFDPGDSPSEYSLYRMKKGGGAKQFLTNCYADTDTEDEEVSFVLTKEAILYNDHSEIYAISLGGGTPKKLVEDGYLFGIEDEWIYFTRFSSSRSEEAGALYDALHRMRIDGTGKEKVLELADARGYIVDQGQEFYLTSNKKKTEHKVIMRTNGGKETVLAECSDWTECLNKEGDWLYFANGNDLYKLNVAKRGEKQLVYSFPDKECYIKNIYLQDGDVFVVSRKDITQFDIEEKKIFIKKDGTVIDLTNDLPEYENY